MPTRSCTQPVRIAARDAEQTADDTLKSVKRRPSCASRSRCGVGVVPPYGPMSP
jgi:hypothetical protein